MKKGAIFDMDGLMFDTESLYYICWRNTAEFYERPFIEEFYKSIQGTSHNLTLEVVKKFYPGIEPEEFVAKCWAIIGEMVKDSVPIKKGLREILSYFKENGVKMAVASSSKKNFILRNLNHTGVSEYFDAVLSGQQVEHGKPAPDIFLLAAKELGLDASDCYVFEDSHNGIRAGAAAGCTTIMIPDLIEPTDEIRALYDGEFKSLLDAMEAIKKGII